jgi:hypothetical protein
MEWCCEAGDEEWDGLILTSVTMGAQFRCVLETGKRGVVAFHYTD